jgi:hypothetical protein
MPEAWDAVPARRCPEGRFRSCLTRLEELTIKGKMSPLGGSLKVGPRAIYSLRCPVVAVREGSERDHQREYRSHPVRVE